MVALILTICTQEENFNIVVSLNVKLTSRLNPLLTVKCLAFSNCNLVILTGNKTCLLPSDQSNTYGKVITVKHGNYSRKIGIDGTRDAIKETMKTAFWLRRKRPFMLEDESNVIHTIDRDMPSGQYTLHFDEGVTIQVRFHDEVDHLQEYVEAKTFYGEDDFHNYLSRHGWSCLKKCHSHRTVDNVDELVPGAIYRGGKLTSL